MNGTISGTVVKAINFMLFTPLLAVSHTTKTSPATIQCSLTDFELVILV